jgi:hypothetical protein
MMRWDIWIKRWGKGGRERSRLGCSVRFWKLLVEIGQGNTRLKAALALKVGLGMMKTAALGAVARHGRHDNEHPNRI